LQHKFWESAEKSQFSPIEMQVAGKEIFGFVVYYVSDFTWREDNPK
jgi:hypothetical protein